MCEKKLVPKLRFSGFDDEWKAVKLNKVGDIVTGATPPTKNKSNFTNSGYLWVTPGDIDSKKFVSKTERNLSEEGLKNGRKLEPYSILVTCIGATIGKICMINEVGSCNQQLNAISPHENFYPDFIYYNIQKTAKNLILLAGNTATPILNKKSFGNLSYNFPSFDEQKKIALFIDKIDQKIELLEQKYQEYQDFKKYLMQQIFAQKLRFDKQNEWKTVEIKSVVSEYKEKAGDNEYPILSSTLSGIFLQSDYFDKNVNSSDTQDYKVVPKGFFTYRSMSDTGVFRFNIQNIVEKGIISPAYPVFTTENINDMFLEQYLNNSPYIKRQILTLKEGGTRYALGFNKFKKLKIEVPSVNEQNKIADCFNTVDTKINHVDNELKNINNFKKGLLQQMFV